MKKYWAFLKVLIKERAYDHSIEISEYDYETIKRMEELIKRFTKM